MTEKKKSKKKKIQIKKVNKPFKMEFSFELDDLIYNREDEEEIEYATPYVGTYIIRRMGTGARRIVESSFVQIETELKSNKKEVEIKDIVPDLSKWQDEIVLHSLYDSPFGKRPYGGWDSKIFDLRKFYFEMPTIISDQLFEASMIINEFTEDDRKN